MFRATMLTAAFALAAGVTTARAAPLTTADVLSQFNLVTFGDVSGYSQVAGRSLIGGDLSSSWMVFQASSKVPASAYAALTVNGNISGGAHVNNGGNALVSGSVGFLNMNGRGTATVGGTGTVQGGPVVRQSVSIPSFEATLKDSSAALALLAGVAPTVSHGRGVFNAAPTNGTTVYSLSLDFFSLVNEIQLSLNGAETVIINVAGKSATLADNFLGNSLAAAPNVLWNFYEATSLTLDRQFIGSVLAPYAQVRVSNGLEGTLIADSARVDGMLRMPGFAGSLPAAPAASAPTPVPAPAALPVFLVGLAGLGAAALWRRRRAV